VQRQLADWVRAGKMTQFRRGLYTFAPPYQTEKPHSYLVANHLVRGSYVSLHMALSDLIYRTPEGDKAGYIRALRLQNLDQFNLERLAGYVQRAHKPKLTRALPQILHIIAEEATAYVTL